MEPAAFVEKWTASTLKESAAAQEHFSNLCALLGEPTPAEADPEGRDYAREYGATKSTGGQGFADVFKRGHFGWEYKGPGKSLDAAYDQLLRYAVALDNPPLLVVSDTKRIVIHTNFTNTVRETHALDLDDLLDASKRDLLKAVFSDPDALKPKKTRQELTKNAADEFSALAQRLRDRGHAPETVAHFVNRLVFCMFAEDVKLLPNKLFEKAMRRSEHAPEKASKYLTSLFAAMREGGEFGLEEVPWFNGGLFDTDEALPMDRQDVKLALGAAKLDWSDIDPSILGTLFERGLDPSKRSQLGAHYTDREKIMMIVEPVIVRPLTAEWEETKATIRAELDKAEAAKSKAAATRAQGRAEAAREAFLERLASFRVLDPACGSGNFLYLSLLALKDIEHRANLDAEAMGLPRGFPRVGPEAVRGIEINPYAAELARVSVWIGEIQWMRRNGFAASTNPVLRPLDHIECRDAVLAYDEDGTPVQAAWPEADVIVGNPPFLGDKVLRSGLGDQYVDALFAAYAGRNRGGADLVTYWFVRGLEARRAGAERVGFVSTNSIRGGANRSVLQPLAESEDIFAAWSDEPWVVDGAAVRVSLVMFGERDFPPTLNGEEVGAIHSDLTAGVKLTDAVPLPENERAAFIGRQKDGPINVPYDVARPMLEAPNPHDQPNSDIVAPWVNGMDVVRRPSGQFIIDFKELSEQKASLYEAPFEYVREHLKPLREKNRDRQRRELWWRPGRSGEDLRDALDGLDRFIATARVAKHRLYRWVHGATIPDCQAVVFARDDDTTFGVLHSRFHELWSLRMGTFLGKGNDPRYTPTTCFETFPFPDGLTPDTAASDYADDTRAQAIAEAARTLDDLRERWLNPPEWVDRVPEVVPGYPDRLVPKDEEAAKKLKRRTLTNLYNERPAWLDHAHRDLDRAVAAAYGWAEDFEAGALSEDEVLARLFALNQARAG